jgi:hypothetical protein
MIRQPLFRALHRILLGVLLISTTIAAAQTGFDIYRFPKGGHRGFGPQAGLVADSEGNLYGTTQSGWHGQLHELLHEGLDWMRNGLQAHTSFC